jgi:hypothetical protein
MSPLRRPSDELRRLTGVPHVPISPELADELTYEWSDPVRMKIEHGVLVFQTIEEAPSAPARASLPMNRLAEQLGGGDYLVVDAYHPIESSRETLRSLALPLYQACVELHVFRVQMGPYSNLDGGLEERER